jgi:DNA-binding PadR family transcriptional regulator
MPSSKHHQPLTPLTMAILLALAKEDMHGYALMQEIESQTEGALVPGTGSLYAALQRLADEGLVKGSSRRPTHSEDERRRYFRITSAGRLAAREEAHRMIRVLETAHRKSVITEVPPLHGAQ